MKSCQSYQWIELHTHLCCKPIACSKLLVRGDDCCKTRAGNEWDTGEKRRGHSSSAHILNRLHWPRACNKLAVYQVFFNLGAIVPLQMRKISPSLWQPFCWHFFCFGKCYPSCGKHWSPELPLACVAGISKKTMRREWKVSKCKKLGEKGEGVRRGRETSGINPRHFT